MAGRFDENRVASARRGHFGDEAFERLVGLLGEIDIEFR